MKPSACEQLQREYEDLRELKRRFDSALEKATTGAENPKEAEEALREAKRLRVTLEQKRDALKEKLYSVDIVKANTESIINELKLNLSFNLEEKQEVGGKKRIIVRFGFGPRLAGINQKDEKEKERLNIVNDIVKILTHRRNKIRDLDIGHNNIGADDARALAEAIKHENNKLERLYIGGNNIGADGAEALAEAIKHANNKLKGLDVGNNLIGADGAKALADALDQIKKKGGEIRIVGI